jgi:ureidoacrylate peracid hydrolase
VTHLVISGCTTSICVDSTVRDAMFRDYLCVLLADCMSEPIGHGLPQSNHAASLLSAEMALGWISDSERILKAVQLVIETHDARFGPGRLNNRVQRTAT